MSAEGQTYVERYSPYTGSIYDVHLRLGLLSNDAHEYLIYSGDKYLADKCRCSLVTIKRAKAQLIKDGFLIRLKPAVGRQYAEFQFVFKGVEIAGHLGPPEEIAGHLGPNSGSSEETSPIYLNKRKEEDFVDLDAVKKRNREIFSRGMK
jgi:hypothetical protein